MIDRAQLNLERSADELRSLHSKNIFTEEEINKIIKERKSHEYKIIKPQKKLSDFLRYLEFEINLEKEKEIRKEKKEIKNDFTDLKSTRRIILIFKKALQYFFDERLFAQFVDYLDEKECTEEMKDYFANICLLRFNDSDLWIFCGTKLFEKKEIDAGRSLLQKGLRIHKKFSFYKEYFKIEFSYFKEALELSKEVGLDPKETELEDGAVLVVLFKEVYGLFGESEEINLLLKMFDGYEILKKAVEESILEKKND